METVAQGFDVATGERKKFTPSAVLLQDAGCWPGVQIEEWIGEGSELPDTVLFEHGITINLEPVGKQEIAWEGGRRFDGPYAARSIGILPAGVAYRVRSVEPWHGFVLGITPALLHSIAGESVDLAPGYGVRDEYVVEAVMALAADVREGHPAGSLYGETVSAALAAHLVRRYRGKGECAIKTHRATREREKIRELVMDRLGEPLSLAEMAAHVELDVYAFARWFKSAFGVSPHRYVLLARIERAKSRLASPRTSLADLALECGFSSQSHFASTFRRVVGVSPGAYRLRYPRKGEPERSRREH